MAAKKKGHGNRHIYVVFREQRGGNISAVFGMAVGGTVIFP